MSRLQTEKEKCVGCSKQLPQREFLRCSECTGAYDLECANMSMMRFNSFYRLDLKRRDNWKCPECLCKQPKHGNLNTPARSTSLLEPECEKTRPSLSPEQRNSTENVTHRKKPSIMGSHNLSSDTENPDAEDQWQNFKLFWAELKLARADFSSLSSSIKMLADAVKEQTERIDRIEKAQKERIDSLETRLKCLENKKDDSIQIDKLEQTIHQLKLELDERDQTLLANDLEIVNYPETGNESATHVILATAKMLCVELEERDVVSAHRVGAPPRPRPLAVRLARRSLRDALLQAARVRRRLTTDGLGLPPDAAPRTFYINERLTRTNRLLFQKTREHASRLGWRFVWTRDGKVFTRRGDGSPRHQLRCDSDLLKIFGDPTVSSDTNPVTDCIVHE